MQSASERRLNILEYICEVRHDKIENLMTEFNASRSTIKRDIEILSITYPLYTLKGTGGGVYVAERYYLNKKYLSESQTELLEKLALKLKGKDLDEINSIIRTFGAKELLKRKGEKK